MEEYRELPAEEEITRVYNDLIQHFTTAQSKYEDVSKLLTGLAAGALVLSTSLMGRDNTFFSRYFLLASWVCLLVSVVSGIIVLFKIYKLHKNLCRNIKQLAQDAEIQLEKARSEGKEHGMLTFEGTLLKKMKTLIFIEPKKWQEWLVYVQLGTFLLGSSSLFVYSVLNYMNPICQDIFYTQKL
jgi:uncharacterized membrane protein YcjF (UPF0283 family)